MTMRIIGPPSGVYSEIRRLVIATSNIHGRFIDEMFDPLWGAALEYGLDPVGMIAQAAKETGWGKYPGAVLPGFYNTAGIKIRNLDAPGYPTGNERFAHQQFANWRNGAGAHAQHLCAYAGVPVPEEIRVDPRFEIVWAKDYRCQHFEDLSGRWAIPGPTYGQEIVAIAQRWLTEGAA